MAIAFQNVKTATAQNASSLSIPIGIGSAGAEPAIVGCFVDSVKGRTFSAGIVNTQKGSVSLTSVALLSVSSNLRMMVGFRELTNDLSVSGAAATVTAVAYYGGGLDVCGIVTSWTGVKAVGGLGATQNATASATATASANLASTVGGMMVFCGCANAVDASWSASAATGAGFVNGTAMSGQVVYLSAAGSTVNLNAHLPTLLNRCTTFLVLSISVAAAPSAVVPGGLAMAGCGYRWIIDDLFPLPPFEPEMP